MKIPRKFLNKLGRPHILPKYFHPISIIPISRNNSQAYIPLIFSIFNLWKFISLPSQLQITWFHHKKSPKFKLYMFLPFAPLFGAFLNSSLFAFPFYIFNLNTNHSSSPHRSSRWPRIFAYAHVPWHIPEYICIRTQSPNIVTTYTYTHIWTCPIPGYTPMCG